MAVILVGLQEIQQKILDLLAGDINLKEHVKISRYYYGPVDPDQVVYPYISVEQIGVPVKPRDIAGGRHYFNLRYRITIVDKHASNDEAEKSVQDKTEYAIKKLAADPSLGSKVDNSFFTGEIEWESGVRRENEFLAGARLTLEALKEA